MQRNFKIYIKRSVPIVNIRLIVMGISHRLNVNQVVYTYRYNRIHKKVRTKKNIYCCYLS